MGYDSVQRDVFHSDDTMTDSGQRLERLTGKLRRKGMRVTPQRLAILRVLLEGESHPSVEQAYTKVHEEYPMLSLATVYKTLNLLIELGEAVEVGFVGGAARYDAATPYAHEHLICTRCGSVRDLADDRGVDVATPQRDRARGWRLSGRVDVWGLCPECIASDRQQ